MQSSYEKAAYVGRREFLKVAGATLAASATTVSVSVGRAATSGGAERQPLVIDCHAHPYGTDAELYPTVERPYRPPPGTGTLEHLRREMKRAGVTHVTLIQTSTFYKWDNRFTVDSARGSDGELTAVCTLDPDNPRSPEILRRYVREGGVRGMRSIPGRSGRLDDAGVDKLWSVAADLGIVINVLVNRDQRRNIEALARRHPRLRFVIDHCLNLSAGPDMSETLQDVLALAELPNAHAKLTFIPTGSAEEYPCRDLHDPCRRIIEAFEPNRCVWGSDFPCELWCPKLTYSQHLRIFTHYLGLDARSQREILGETAHKLWFAPLNAPGATG